MNFLFLFCSFACLLLIGGLLLGWFLLKTHRDEPGPEPAFWPKVAILIAARNEAPNLGRCLSSIEKLDYPPDRLTVWIGNDGSQDATLRIAHSFSRRYAHWHVLDVTEEWGQARGKANVLAQLASAAASFADFYFITDADVSVSESWVKCLLRFFRKGVGLVSGSSVVVGKTFFSRMQDHEWILGQGWLKAYACLPFIGESLTAIGHNMAVQKQAYQAVGGYENIPFSITEDFELLRQLKLKGYKGLNICNAGAKVYTLSVFRWEDLLQQRKRWMSGAMQLPLLLKSFLFIQALFLPCLLVVLWNKLLFGIVFLLVKLIVQALFVRQVRLKIDEPPVFPFLGFEWYSWKLGFSQIVFYLLPVPVKWKERMYL